jgi:urease accessory protein
MRELPGRTAIIITTTIEKPLFIEPDETGTPPAPAAPVSGVEGCGLPAVTLMAWLSPSFPVGSFAFSHGLEWAAEVGDVKDVASVTSWIGALLDSGGPNNDAILLAVAWRAIRDRDRTTLGSANALAIGLAGSRERRLETVAQGNAFLETVIAAWGAEAIATAREDLSPDVAYPIAVGITSAAHQISLTVTLEAYCLAVVQNLMSALIRLNALGQTDGQRAIAALLPKARSLADRAQHSTLDDLGGASFRSDIAALRHETQYTRLFRS